MNDLSRLANYIVLREQGKSYQEIADMYGVSKQNVQEIISIASKRYGERIRKSTYDIEKIAYKGIYDLFANDKTMTFSRIARECTGISNNKTVGKFKRLFLGQNVNITIRNIQKLVEFSGMTFEQLFAPRKRSDF